tara:strand:+ start:4650 stop:5417 length:768 start_codon:yes stop_codon:yes gene_type:complete
MAWEISNNVGEYLNSCRDAALDNRYFNQFKQDPRYRQILEHVSFEEASMYASKLPIEEVLKNLNKFKENDNYGNPDIHEFDDLGEVSPTTVRYIKNTFDIINRFGSDIGNIVEIGGGYGGLCKVLSGAICFSNYLIFDLEEPNMLSKKYLSKFDDLDGRVQSLTLEELGEIDGIDLLISNYAFSEVSLDVQEEYYENVIKKSKHIYMVFNPISSRNLKFSDFVDRLTSDGFDVEYSCEHEESENCNKILYASCLN